MEQKQFQKISKALADPQRFQVLEMIAAQPETACKSLVDSLPISQATISHHIKELDSAGLIDVRREGKCAHLKFAPKVMKAYRAELARRLDPPSKVKK